MQRRNPRYVVAVGVGCVLGVLVVSAIAGVQMAAGQEQPRAPTVPEAERAPGPQVERRDRPEGERRERRERGDEAARRAQEWRERRFGAELMMARQMPAIAVADGKVFVVLGGMLYKFDAETLALEGQQRIPRPSVPPPAARAGRQGREQRPPVQDQPEERN